MSLFDFRRRSNLSVGIGSSSNEDPYLAAKEAAKISLSKEKKIEPTFSIVYTDPRADQNEIARGINEIIGKNWAGASVDKQISSNVVEDKNTVVSIITFFSDYLSFGVSVTDNYRESPVVAGRNTAMDAIKNLHIDKNVDSYIQFARSKTQDYSSLIKVRPYIIMCFVGGEYKQNGEYVSGKEASFLEGIVDYTGPNIAMFGLSAGSDFQEFLDPNSKSVRNYQFANGDVYTDAGVVLFINSNVYFEVGIEHSYNTTSDYAAITKIDKNGNDILELNGKEPVAEYCRITNISKKKYLEDPFAFSLKRPFGSIALDGSSYIREALPNPDGKTLHSTYKLKKNMILNILKHDQKSLYTKMSDVIDESLKENKKRKMAVALFTNCSSRRLLMNFHEEKANKIVVDRHKDIPFFGCYSFGEIGSSKTSAGRLNGETITTLIFYDNLLIE